MVGRRLGIALLLAGSVVTAACVRTAHDDGIPSAGPVFEDRLDDRVVLRQPEPLATPAWDAIVACEADDQCMVVEMGCCEGEGTMSIARSAHDEARELWAKDCPRGRRCFQPPAHGWVEAAVCDHGACARIEDQLVLRPDGSWSSGLVLVPTSEPPWGSRPPASEAQAQTVPYAR